MGRGKAGADHRAMDPEVGHRVTTPGSDFLQLEIGAAPVGGRADWLAAQLRLAIADGRVPVGSRLPASRVLAGELGVSRGVVTEAYQRLVEDGHVAGRGRGGTVVLAAGLPTAPRSRPPGPVAGPAPAPAGFPATPSGPGMLFGTAPGTDIFEALRAAPARIDLSPGVPDLAAFPRAAWLRAERTVLDALAPADLGYGDPRGAAALRSAAADWLARFRGIRADPDELLIVAGVSQALALLARVLVRDGIRQVAVEDPGSLGARQHLRNWGLDTPPVPVDPAGLRVDELARGGAPAVMVTPAHQFPTGVVLGGDRRRALIRWAEAGGLVVEDDYDAEHRYDRPPVPALRAVLPEGVCYTGSVSKLLAPALRIGWMLAPSRYRDDLVAAKRDADLGNAVLPQLVLAELMRSGGMERHLRLLRRRHVRRRDTMIRAIATHLPGTVVHGAAAGLHLMVTLTADLADVDLAAAALARGVKVQPLSWHCQRPYRPGLVLGYAATAAGEIEEGVAAIGAALRGLR
ncbi:PLP-dependent aminotransferase family protein [Plantactinospora sp. CA-290183]|uniref:MocR-like pyridoxine biosynthesis transcription factor PdxR n=1 Tax=Plantactinospora sp. CA-290183 TaxID=3240006 RepID=UPI003D8A00B0